MVGGALTTSIDGDASVARVEALGGGGGFGSGCLGNMNVLGACNASAFAVAGSCWTSLDLLVSVRSIASKSNIWVDCSVTRGWSVGSGSSSAIPPE